MKKIVLIVSLVLCVILVNAQKKGYEFEKVVDLKTSSVKSQGSTGTCWCFATISFLESELLRMGKPEYDLSEMYIVKKAYEQKANDYIKFHGLSNFSQGGQAHDVMNEIIDHGLVPESVLDGLEYGSERHNHREYATVLTNFLDGVLKSRKPTTAWLSAFNSISDAYLGQDPETFTLDGKEYTPQSFAKDLEIDPANYIEFTSYANYPDYEKIVLEVPDNWSHDYYYNVPLDDFIKIMENSLNQGYTFVWDGDMSDKGFSRKEGIAVVEDGKDVEKTYLKSPAKEKHIDAEFRLKEFENFNITDDHLMHITGIVKDQNGVKYYKTKNSWGDKGGFDGYWNMSEQFMRLHTVAILVHKDAVPDEILKKIGL